MARIDRLFLLLLSKDVRMSYELVSRFSRWKKQRPMVSSTAQQLSLQSMIVGERVPLLCINVILLSCDAYFQSGGCYFRWSDEV